MSSARRPAAPAVAAPAEVPALAPDTILRMHASHEERIRDLEVQVRELQRAVAALTPSTTPSPVPAPVAPPVPPSTVREHEEQERKRILEALELARWNRVRAAEMLGIPRRTFYRKLRDYGIQ